MKLKSLLIKTILIIILLYISIYSGNAIAQTNLRPIDSLVSDSSGIAILNNAIRIARNRFEILPVDTTKAKVALYQTQVTTRSPMGAIIYFTGGILIEDGWIRILGSGSNKLDRSLPGWNKGKTFTKYGGQPKFLLVADDVVGGFFAINGGGLGNEMGKIYYLAPDDLKWESLHITYTDFINFCFVGDMKLFYGDLGWPQCRQEVIKLTGNDSFYFYPYRWTKEGKYISKDERSVVPVNEIYTLETEAIKTAGK